MLPTILGHDGICFIPHWEPVKKELPLNKEQRTIEVAKELFNTNHQKSKP